MPPETTEPRAAAPINPSALRIVLFGMPGAGKTSLLGALAQAVQAHERVFNYRLVDRSQELTSLQHRVYDGHPEETVAETVAYPLGLEPFPDNPPPDGQAPQEVVLIDSGGAGAGSLMARREPLEPEGQLAREILEADTLVLVVDGSEGAAQLERDFARFAEFLELLEKSRALRSDVAGLPVYLVSAKCDLLAQKGDTSLTWMERVEERKLQIGERFRQLLARQEAENARAFGSISLHLWATAIKRPALADVQPSPPPEPYGVAELFRQCIDSARTFHARETRAGATLTKTVVCSIGLVVILAVLGLVFAVTHPGGEMTDLDLKVEKVRTFEREQSESRKHQKLDDRIAELVAIRDNRDFRALAPERRNYVRDLLKKLTAYRKVAREYEKKLAEIRQPQDAVNREQLDEAEDRLRRLKAPRDYEGDWSQTPVGREREQWLKDIDLIRSAVGDTRKWYYRAYLEAEKLLNTGEAATLPSRAKKFLANMRSTEPDADKPIAKGQTTVSYKTVLDFDTVVSVRERWEEKKRELQVLAGRAKSEE